MSTEQHQKLRVERIASDRATGKFASLLGHPASPYLLSMLAWLLVYWAQMGPLYPFLNFVPGVELPFFPAGISTLAVFIFGFAGAIGIFLGSLITYFFFYSDLSNTSVISGLLTAGASAFSAWLAMRAVCIICHIPNSLSGLTLRNVGWIVMTQGFISATLHQIIYHIDVISPAYADNAIEALAFNWSAMVAGDTLGSMLVLLAVLGVHDTYQRYLKL